MRILSTLAVITTAGTTLSLDQNRILHGTVEITHIRQLLAHFLVAIGLAVVEPTGPLAHTLVHMIVARGAATIKDGRGPGLDVLDTRSG